MPPLPRKILTDRFVDKVTNKRIKGFEVKFLLFNQKFLESLSNNVEIKNYIIFYKFMQIEDSISFIKFKKVVEYF